MHTILINGLKLPTSIGVYSWEQHITQHVILDIEIITDITQAAHHDDLSDALDYSKICAVIAEYLQSRHFNLLETLASKVADLVHDTFSCKQFTLTAHKPYAIPQATGVAIRIIRDYR